MSAVSFELGISLGEISKVQFAHGDVPALDDASTWFVRAGADDVVTIHARVDGRVREIARAKWSALGRLVDRSSTKQQVPNDHQWKVVATAIGRIKRRAIAGVPAWRRALGSIGARVKIDPTARPILIGAIIMGLAMIGVVAAIFVIRTDDPVTTRIAAFEKLVWSDVDGGGETTLPLIKKDPERERGRKLCVVGTVDAIERTTIDGRSLHAGTLRTADGDTAPFVALGSTRSVVARYAGRFCGVANGKTVIGLFDLPENRER